MGINYEIRKFETGLVSYINGSDLPIEVKSLVIDKILNVVKEKSDSVISLEMKEGGEPIE